MEKKNKITLEQIGTELPFEVPANYFDQFASEFEESINVKQVTFNKILKTLMYIAAVFIGVFLIGQFFFKIYNDSNVKKHENYEAYVLMQVDEASIIDCYVDNTNN